MVDSMILNTNTYTIEVSDTSGSVVLSTTDAAQTNLVIYNGSDVAAFVVSGIASATAVLPTAETPALGKMIAPGATVSFTKPMAHNAIAAIQPSAGTGNLYISTGIGV